MKIHKIAHSFDVSKELAIARNIAELAVKNKNASSKGDFEKFNLNQSIVKELFEKYSKASKSPKSVRLIVPAKLARLSEYGTMKIPSLNLQVDISFLPAWKEIKKLEISRDFVYIYAVDPEPGSYFLDLVQRFEASKMAKIVSKNNKLANKKRHNKKEN